MSSTTMAGWTANTSIEIENLEPEKYELCLESRIQQKLQINFVGCCSAV